MYCKTIFETIHIFPARWTFDTSSRALQILDERPPQVDLGHIDFNELTDEQLQRIIDGEDPFRLIRGA